MEKKKKNSAVATGTRFLLLVTAMAGALGACGDAHVFKVDPGDIDPSAVPTDHACFTGSAIKLIRHSSACTRTSPALASNVRDGMVFSADEVGTLGAPCENGPTPSFEVHFDEASHSILLDFAQVEDSARFPENEFEGYTFEIAIDESNGLLLRVEIDRERSNLEVDARDIDWDPARIELNLEGVAYDEQGSLKLDLWFARVAPTLQ
jgi:hypothetical protein